MSYELAELTVLVAQASGVNFFEILEKDMEDVIFFLNYLIERSEETPQQAQPQPSKNKGSKLDSFWDYI